MVFRIKRGVNMGGLEILAVAALIVWLATK